MAYLKTLQKRHRKGDTTLVLGVVKLSAVFLFVFGVVSVFGAEEFGSVSPLSATAEEEVTVEHASQDVVATPADVFVSGRLRASVDAPAANSGDKEGVGGAIDPTLPSTQSSALLASHMVEIPEPPDQNRTKITYYTVKPHDTPSGIAAKFGLRLETILWANNLRSSSYIHPGDKLAILPVDGINYDVKQGDTLASIARAHQADVDDILKFNEIESARHIVAGQKLIIPGGEKSTRSPRSTQPTPRNTGQRYASSQRNLNGYFIRPTSGRISQGYHRWHRAFDIADSCWTPVYAAASGTVRRAVNYSYNAWVGGFGNVVEIDHPNNTRSIYAHFAPNGVAVSVGQWVEQGQLIGHMGSTGRSTGCHLHWEVHGARHPML